MFKVVLSRQSKHYYSQLPLDLAKQAANVFRALEEDVFPRGAKPLKGELKGLYRIRIGGLRIIYKPQTDIGEIRILRIGPRGDIY